MRNRLLLIPIAVAVLSLGVGSKVQASNEAHYHYQQFSISEGLTHQSVTALYCDTQRGIVWVGTEKGLNMIINGYVYPRTYLSASDGSVELGRINKIFSPPNAQQIFISSEKGVLIHEFGSKSVEQFKYEGKPVKARAMVCNEECAYIYSLENSCLLKYDFNSKVTSVVVRLDKTENLDFSNMLFLQNMKESILLVDKKNGLFLMDLFTGQLSYLNGIGNDINPNAVFQDMYGTLWVAKYNKGVYGYKPLENFRLYKSFTTENSALPHNNVVSISETSDSHLCLGTDGGGLCFIDKQMNNFVIETADFVRNSQVVASFNSDLIVGTQYNGLVVLRKNGICLLSSNNVNGDVRLTNSIVSSLYDDNGKVWLGTMGGGVNCFDESTRMVTAFKETEGKQISAIAEYDDNTLLLFSLYDHIYLMDKKTGKLSVNSVIDQLNINYDNSGYHNVIVCNAGTNYLYAFNINGEQFVLNKKDKIFRKFSLFQNVGHVSDEYVIASFPLSERVIVVTNYSIYEVDNKTLLSKRLFSSDTRLLSASVDGNSNIWFVNTNGVYRYNRIFNELTLEILNESRSFFTTVLVDKAFDRVWLANSSNELLVFDTNDKSLSHYSQDDGLPYKTVFFNKSFMSSLGFLYFPSSSGLCVVNPIPNLTPQRSDVKVECRSVLVDDSQGSSFSQDNSKLTVSSNFKSLYFVNSLRPLNPLNAAMLQYTLKNGDDVVYQSQTEDPFISFNKLSSGNYTLYASVFEKNGWNNDQKLAEFRVLPNIITFAIPIFSVLCLAIILICILIPLRQKRNTYKWKKEEQSRQEDSDRRMKLIQSMSAKSMQSISGKFNNIGIEIKNIQKINTLTDDAYADLENLYELTQNISNSLILVSDVLNLKKTITLKVSSVNIRQCIESVVSRYRVNARIKGLDVKVVCPDDLKSINVDAEKLDFVLGTMLDNAIKFSENGTIQIVVSLSTLGNIKISFIDEGCGINVEPDTLFAPLSTENNLLSGMGIHLYVSKVVIERMNGQIGAYNNLNKGATFFIALPTTLVVTENESAPEAVKDLSAKELPLDSLVENELMTGRTEDVDTELNRNNEADNFTQVEELDPFLDRYTTINPDVEFNTLGYTLLVVDDQQDNLDFLQEEYADLFKEIYVAHDGVEGLEKIHKHYPNIIVSDILMPRMNGFEMCKAVKSDLDISHLPVVLLTSRNDSSFQDVGYKLGADAFVPKPFDTKMLYNILKTQLRNRFEIKRQYAITGLPEITEEYTFSLADEKFVKKLNQYINDNISNPDLNVDMMVEHMCVSRSTLFNKMRSLCGVTSNKYIRKIRIERAKELLSKTDRSVFEIAIDTGFTESQYFSTVFKQETGCTPSQYRTEVIQSNSKDNERN